MIILICGRRTCGKTTLGNAISKYLNFHHFTFADAVKESYCETHNVDLKSLDDYHVKARHRKGIIEHANQQKEFDERVWAKIVSRMVKPGSDCVISDLRFPYELDQIRDDHRGEKIFVVKITCPDAIRATRGWKFDPDIDFDISEVMSDKIDVDFTFSNDGNACAVEDFCIYDLPEKLKDFVG